MILNDNLIKAKCKTEHLNLIKNLNICAMNLSDVTILSRTKNLEVISLSVNQISTLSAFSNLEHLRELYLRNNIISDLREILHLKNLPMLKILWLSNNPIANHKNYRNFIIQHLRGLVSLDNKSITDEERKTVFKDDFGSNNSAFKSESVDRPINRLSTQSRSKSIKKEHDKHVIYEPNQEIIDQNNEPLLDNYKERRLKHRMTVLQKNKESIVLDSIQEEDLNNQLSKRPRTYPEFQEIEKHQNDKNVYQISQNLDYKPIKRSPPKSKDTQNEYEHVKNDIEQPIYQKAFRKSKIEKVNNLAHRKDNSREFEQEVEVNNDAGKIQHETVMTSIFVLLEELDVERVFVIQKECNRLLKEF